MAKTNGSVIMRQKRRQRERTMLKEHDLERIELSEVEGCGRH